MKKVIWQKFWFMLKISLCILHFKTNAFKNFYTFITWNWKTWWVHHSHATISNLLWETLENLKYLNKICSYFYELSSYLHDIMHLLSAMHGFRVLIGVLRLWFKLYILFKLNNMLLQFWEMALKLHNARK